MNSLIAALALVSIFLCAQAFHTSSRCDSRYSDLLKEAASIAKECVHEEPKIYDCCTGAVMSNLYHGYYHSLTIFQVHSSCKNSDDPFLTSSSSRLAHCDMKSDNGGWLVIFRRNNSVSPRVNFNRNWNDYENGFGNLETEFWYGLREMHCLTQKEVEMRIDLTATNGTKFYWTYGLFKINGPETNYTLQIGEAVGSPGLFPPDPFTYNNNHQFTTKDRDNDLHVPLNCANHYRSGWWWTICGTVRFFGSSHPSPMRWYQHNRYVNISYVEMKIRPKQCGRLLLN